PAAHRSGGGWIDHDGPGDWRPIRLRAVARRDGPDPAGRVRDGLDGGPGRTAPAPRADRHSVLLRRLPGDPGPVPGGDRVAPTQPFPRCRPHAGRLDLLARRGDLL